MVTESPGINSHTLSTSAAIPAQYPTNKPKALEEISHYPRNEALEKPSSVNTQTLTQTEENKEESKTNNISFKELGGVLDEINKTMYSMNKSLKFEINDKTEDLVVRVINTDTDQVIRQYPSEEVLKRKEQLLEGDMTEFSVKID